MSDSEDLIKLFNKALILFEGDEEKTSTWFFSCFNPIFGGVSPEIMILDGKIDKLEKIIDEAIEANGGAS